MQTRDLCSWNVLQERAAGASSLVCTGLKTGYNRWLSCRLQNQPPSFLAFALFNFYLCCGSVTNDEVSNLIKANNDQLIASTVNNLYRRYIDDCVGATSSTREELNQFITAVNSFHPALKYTWEISDTSLAFLDIKVSVEGNGLCTSVHYKPTDSHSYLLYSSSHPLHVKNFIPYSQFLRLRRLCSEDSHFSLKSGEMCEFFDKRGYPASIVEAGHHRAQQIDRQSALQTSQKGITIEFRSLSHFTLRTTQ